MATTEPATSSPRSFRSSARPPRRRTTATACDGHRTLIRASMTILHPLVRTSPAATTSTSARGSRLPRPGARGTTPSAPCLWKASSDGVPLPRNGREATSPLVHGHPSRRRARRLSECEAVLARMSAMTAGWSCSLKCDSPAACLLVIISPVPSRHVLPWRLRCAAPLLLVSFFPFSPPFLLPS